MDYTQSNSYAVDAGTGQRLHLQAQAVPTAVTDQDMNSVIWSLMEIIKAAGLAGAQFDKTNPATYQKLLTALRSPGVFQTPAQFDATTKPATTAFVQSNGLNYWFSSVLASRNLALSDIGTVCWFGGGYTVTMPTPGSLGLALGKAVTFYNTGVSNALIIAGAGAVFDCLSSPVTVKSGEAITFVVSSNTQWMQFGTADLGKTASFGASLLSPGYQKLPSGLIMQWGINTVTAGTNLTVTLPIAFPSTPYFIVATAMNSTSPAGNYATAYVLSNSQIGLAINANTLGVSWLAFGK